MREKLGYRVSFSDMFSNGVALAISSPRMEKEAPIRKINKEKGIYQVQLSRESKLVLPEFIPKSLYVRS